MAPRHLLTVSALLLLLIGLTPLVAQRQRQGDEVLTLVSGETLVGRTVAKSKQTIWFRDQNRGLLAIPKDALPAAKADAAPGPVAGTVPTIAPPKGHVRYLAPKDGKSGGLETAITRWKHEASGTTLLLVGAVHIADAEYFTRLQKIMDATDLVLFEGVGGKAADVDPEDVRSFDAIFQLQMGLNKLLGLTFQKDGIDYKRAHWKNADVDMGTLKREMEARKVSLPTDNPIVRGILKLALAIFNPDRMGADSPMQKRLKRQMASMLGDSDSLLKRMGDIQKVLIDFRNAKAMEVLRAELSAQKSARTMSLFYGAAHLPDFSKTLASEGWVCESLEWVRAWDLQ